MFAELMSRTEAHYRSEDCDRVRGDDSDNDKDSVKSLARRLCSVSLAGTSREEQSILTVLSSYVPMLRQILLSLDASGARLPFIA